MNRRVRQSNGARRRWHREQHPTRSLDRTIRNAVVYGLLDGSPVDEGRYSV